MLAHASTAHPRAADLRHAARLLGVVMAYTPPTIKVDLLMRVHGASETHELATIDLPITFTDTTATYVDTSPITDSGKAIADAMRKAFDDHA